MPTKVRLVTGTCLYRFDPATGVLSISASPHDCGRMFDILNGDSEIDLPGPTPHERRIFKGVKRIESLPPNQHGEWWIMVTE